MSRYRASGIHLLISALFLTLCLGFVVSVWYPGFYVEAEGLLPILIVLLGVDLVLGPLITLIIYKKDKPKLKMDLCLIVVFQVTALGYGCYSMYEARPSYLVYTGREFHVVRSVDIIQSQLKMIDNEQLLTSTFESPTWVYAVGESPAITKFLAGKLLVLSPNYYNEFNELFDVNQPNGYSIEELKLSSKALVVLNDSLLGGKSTGGDYFYIPILGKSKKLLMLMNKVDKSYLVIDVFNVI